MPRLKDGSKSADHVRIKEQADLAKGIFRQLGIKITKTDYSISEKFNDEITFEGLLDVVAEWDMPPMFTNAPFIFDCKLTKDCTSTFGEFSWGRFNEAIDAEKRIYIGRQTEDGMDLLQAYSYLFLMEKKIGVRFNFAYLVFDYKKVLEYKIIIVPYEQQQVDNVIGRLIGTATRLKWFKSLNYPEIPTVKECKTCKVIDCVSRINMVELMANAI